MTVHKKRCLLVWALVYFISARQCDANLADEAEEAEQILSAAVGQQVQLRCDTFSSKAVDWWFTAETSVAKTGVFVNEAMVGDYGSRSIIDNTKHNIIMSHVELKDAGLYTCVEDSGQGKKHNIRLDVSPYMSARLGELLTLPCYTAMSAIAWKYQRSKRGSEKYIYKGAIYNEFTSRFKLLGLHSGYFSLQILNTQLEDSGLYTCVEGNMTSPRYHTFQVIVYVVTSIGANITLPCRPNIKADVDWLRYKSLSASDHDTVYSEGEVYPPFQDRFTAEVSPSVFYNVHIKDVQVIDSGVYICAESSGFGEEHTMELFVSECVAVVNTLVAVVGSPVELTCPSTITEWKYQKTQSDRPLVIFQSDVLTRDGTGRFQVQKDINGTQHLLIKQAKFEDTGFYTCSHETGVHTAPRCIRLDVKESDSQSTTSMNQLPVYKDSDSPNIALAVGLTLGLVLLAIVIVLIVIIVRRRRRTTTRQDVRHSNTDFNKNPQTGEAVPLMTSHPLDQKDVAVVSPMAQTPPLHQTDGVLCCTIQRLKSELIYMIEPDTTRRKLMELNALTIANLHHWMDAWKQEKQTVYDKNSKLIECFAGKSEDICSLFIDALNMSNQEHVANFIKAAEHNATPDGDVRPLGKEVISKLLQNTLLDENLIFHVDKFVYELLSCGCIFERHKKYIIGENAEMVQNAEHGQKSEMAQNKRLVEVLTRRSLANYKSFVNCLKKQQAPLADLLSIENEDLASKDRTDNDITSAIKNRDIHKEMRELFCTSACIH